MTIVKFQRGLTPKKKTRVMVLVVCMSPDDALYFYEVSRKYVERFSHEITIVAFQRVLVLCTLSDDAS